MLREGNFDAFQARSLTPGIKTIVSKARRANKGQGRDLTDAEIDGIMRKYHNNIDRYRGELWARTEMLSAMNAAQDESYQQMIDETGIDPNRVVKIWDATLDDRTREDHANANNQRRFKDEKFDVGGAKMKYPGDRNAPLSQVANCRCLLIMDLLEQDAILSDIESMTDDELDKFLEGTVE